MWLCGLLRLGTLQWVVVSTSYAARHGISVSWVSALAGYRLYGSRSVMGYQDGFRLLEIVRDQVLLAACVSLEFVEFRECFVVFS